MKHISLLIYTITKNRQIQVEFFYYLLKQMKQLKEVMLKTLHFQIFPLLQIGFILHPKGNESQGCRTPCDKGTSESLY